MISFDFAYYRPDSLEEAIDCFQRLTKKNQKVIYYGGGTEIISMARAESIQFDAVIDLKWIPECTTLKLDQDNYIIGSMNSLTNIAEAGYFPLLCKTIARIADHTIQGKITIGGNLKSTIIYREAALPLMVTNCKIKIMTAKGLLTLPFPQIWNGQLDLQPEEFLVQIVINIDDINLPYVHAKRTKMDRIDYPLITLVGNKKNQFIQAAISGASNNPLLLDSEILNSSLSNEDKIRSIIDQIDHSLMSDIQGSKEYRKFVLSNMMSQMFAKLKDK